MKTTITRIIVSALALLTSPLQAAELARVLIIVGPSNHPPGTHEVVAGGRLMQHCLQNMSNLPDRYVNKTRPQLPAESKVSEQAETLLRVAERVILANGGETITIANQPGYRVKLQQPRLIEPLPEKVHGPETRARRFSGRRAVTVDRKIEDRTMGTKMDNPRFFPNTIFLSAIQPRENEA